MIDYLRDKMRRGLRLEPEEEMIMNEHLRQNPPPPPGSNHPIFGQRVMDRHYVHCEHDRCPQVVINTMMALEDPQKEVGAIIQMETFDRTAIKDVPAMCSARRHKVLDISEYPHPDGGNLIVFVIEKIGKH